MRCTSRAEIVLLLILLLISSRLGFAGHCAGLIYCMRFLVCAEGVACCRKRASVSASRMSGMGGALLLALVRASFGLSCSVSVALFGWRRRSICQNHDRHKYGEWEKAAHGKPPFEE